MWTRPRNPTAARPSQPSRIHLPSPLTAQESFTPPAHLPAAGYLALAQEVVHPFDSAARRLPSVSNCYSGRNVNIYCFRVQIDLSASSQPDTWTNGYERSFDTGCDSDVATNPNNCEVSSRPTCNCPASGDILNDDL